MATDNNGKNSSRYTRPARYDRTFFLCRLVFSYVYPTFIQGMRNNGLTHEDIDRCPADDEAEKVTARLKKNWDRAKARSKTPSFAWCVFCTVAPWYTLSFFIYLFEECVIRIAQSIWLGWVIRYFTHKSDITYQWACIYAGGVCLCTVIYMSLHHPNRNYAMQLGMRARTACCALMYQKALRLSRASVDQTAVGQIVNIMSNDVNRFDEFSFMSPYLIVAPIQSVMIVYIVWTYLSWSCAAGIVLLILFIPFQALMGRLSSRIRLRTAKLTDTRLRYMNEIINGMRVIKMYCWERPFGERIANARKAEVGQVRRALFLKAINLSTFFVASRIILFVCFILYVYLGNILTAEAVFVTMTMFNTLRLVLTYLFPQAISAGSELLITCKRIENFLLLEEITHHETSSSNEKSKNEMNSCPSVIVNNITARWSNDLVHPTLHDISFDLKPGDLLAVIGPVGSGKSSLLMTLLKELPLESGNIDLCGKLAYASQEAWSFNDTVRDNVLFGLEYDRKLYDDVIEVCALRRDLTLMPFSDRTLVGERGIALSGGQKARINLARAVYRNADIFLFDDPLSAVDTAVAEHIFERCILDYLRSKIRILVTHQIQFIEKATKILVLQEGNCLAYGSFAELQQMGIDFMSILAQNEDKAKMDGDLQTSISLDESYSTKKSTDTIHQNIKTTKTNSVDDKETTDLLHNQGNSQSYGCFDEKQNEQKKEEEQYQRGSISGRTYMEYIRAGAGPILIILTLLFMIISQTLFHGSDIFLTAWTNKNQMENANEAEKEQNQDIIFYSIIMASLFVSTIFRAVTFFAICMRASVNLHDSIFSRLLRTPVAFFDNNPAGRILNRFTKDLGVIDENLPNTAFELNLNLAQVIGVIVTVSLVNWYLALPAIVLCGVVIFLRNIYIKSATDIIRYQGLARSPIYSHVSTTINGIASIRAFGAQKSFEKQFYVYQNDHSATWFIFISTSRCLGLLMDWVSAVYIIIITVTIMVNKDLPSGSAGLAISSGLLLASMTQWAVRQTTDFESQMTSVERIVEYKSLDQEAPAESSKKHKPDKQWPTGGEIVYDHMSLAYTPEKPVLRDITCTINAGEKIGIVGRTGAGKSSMIAALFRLTEPTGTIQIDGVDINKIGLDDLRKKISIIPQDPVVFSGTVRYNLDPFEEYQDADIWAALEEVQLKAQVDNYAGKLEAPLSESGGNLSVGQRQLICLARAILRRNRILILDEATANVDHQTDELIQRTIRSEFSHCTVLTIAHRLNTIIDCDRVLVLDAGQILEFDTPYRLLKSKGAFYDMCVKAGANMFTHLSEIAKRIHQNNNKRRNGDDDNNGGGGGGLEKKKE